MTTARLVRNYLYNGLVAFSCAVNALALAGDPYESTSSVLGKARRGDWGRGWQIAAAVPGSALDWFMARLGLPDHCARSIDDTKGALSAARRETIV